MAVGRRSVAVGRGSLAVGRGSVAVVAWQCGSHGVAVWQRDVAAGVAV